MGGRWGVTHRFALGVPNVTTCLSQGRDLPHWAEPAAPSEPQMPPPGGEPRGVSLSSGPAQSWQGCAKPPHAPEAPLLLLGFLGLLNAGRGHALQVLKQLIQLVLDGGQHLHSAQAGLLLATHAVPVDIQHLAVQTLQQLVL